MTCDSNGRKWPATSSCSVGHKTPKAFWRPCLGTTYSGSPSWPTKVWPWAFESHGSPSTWQPDWRFRWRYYSESKLRTRFLKGRGSGSLGIFQIHSGLTLTLHHFGPWKQAGPWGKWHQTSRWIQEVPREMPRFPHSPSNDKCKRKDLRHLSRLRCSRKWQSDLPLRPSRGQSPKTLRLYQDRGLKFKMQKNQKVIRRDSNLLHFFLRKGQDSVGLSWTELNWVWLSE